MASVLGEAEPRPSTIAAGELRLLRIMLFLQILLGLLWAVSMLFFARQIVLGTAEGAHVEKIAMEGAAHMALVFGAYLVWRAPARSGGVLLVMIFLNALWTVTDLVYIPLMSLSAVDFYVKTLVNAFLAVGLTLAGRRAKII